MTTMTPESGSVTGGLDTHLDVHVAAVVNHPGRALGTKSFPTTAAGYRRLLRWMRTFGLLLAVGVEGTGSHGSALAGTWPRTTSWSWRCPGRTGRSAAGTGRPMSLTRSPRPGPEAIRCIKRYIAREVFAALPQTAAG